MKKIFLLLFASIGILEANATTFSNKTIINTMSGTYTDDIVIESGVRVEVTGTVKMANYKTITIEPGGWLKVNGGTITNVNDNGNNSCANVWGGIHVLGDPTQPQYSQSFTSQINQTYFKQGVIELINAQIRYSTYGIVTSVEPPLYGGNAYDGGGRIYAENTQFYNNAICAISVSHYNVNKYNGGVGHITIKGCTFNSDFAATNSQMSDYTIMVLLHDAEKVRIANNIFTKTTAPYNKLVMGIALQSGGNINMTPFTGLARQTFSNLYMGINIIGLNPKNPVHIQQADFIDNDYGVYNFGGDLLTIRKNTFKVLNTYTKNGYGIWSNVSTGMLIEDNTFTKTGSNNNYNTRGIWIAGSNRNGNLINKNTFNSIRYGFHGQNNNAGLLLKCNTFTQMKSFDIMNTSGGGIAPNQGASNKAAGNDFTHSGTSGTSDFHQDNGVSAVNYYYYGSGNGTNSQYPVGVSGSVTRSPGSSNSCPFTYNSIIQSIKDAVAATYTDINALPTVNFRNTQQQEQFEMLVREKDVYIAQLVSESYDQALTADVIDWLENDNSFMSKYYLLSLYIANENYTLASQLITQLGNDNTGNDPEITDICTYFTLLNNAAQQTSPDIYLQGQMSSITNLADNSTFIAGKAKALHAYLLNIADDETANPDYYYLNETYPVTVDEPHDANNNVIVPTNTTENVVSVTVFPNPSSGQYSISVTNLQAQTETYTVQIYSSSSNLVYNQQTSVLSNQANVLTADITSQVDGFYYLVVIYNNGIVNQTTLQKLVQD